MPDWTKRTNQKQEVTILLLPRFSNLCLANAVEPFRAANELLSQAFYKWSFVTLDGAPVNSSSGLPILPNGKLRDHPGGEYLFIMSSHDAAVLATPETRRALISADRRFRQLAGMDTGSWLLAHAGLLNSKMATIHPNELVAFAEQFGDVEVVSDRYVFSGRYLTCGGAMSTFDLVLDLIGHTHGESLKLELSTYFLEQLSPPDARLLQRKSYSPIVAKSLAKMGQNIEKPLKIVDMAALLNTSHRNLTRLFESELGASPNVVYRRIRLNIARDYIRQTRHSISEIALRCGYQNSSALTRAFTREFGCAPSLFRRSNK